MVPRWQALVDCCLGVQTDPPLSLAPVRTPATTQSGTARSLIVAAHIGWESGLDSIKSLSTS
jgi:hypothetical protein